jgi:hypothetical protein
VLRLELEAGYQFKVDFGLADVRALPTDATPPLGQGRGPDSGMLLMAAVGNCLSASLAFSLRKFKNDDVPIRTTVDAQLGPNGQGRGVLAVNAVLISNHRPGRYMPSTR